MNRTLLSTAALALAVALGFQLLLGDVGFRHPDEGFLWYGVERVLEGEVPLRDFQAYEPARYYWGAAFERVLGPGVLSLRWSLHAFQALGLFFAFLVLRRAVPGRWWIPLALLVACWMFPRHKLIDISLSMAAVYFALLVVERPSARRHFGAGLCVGIAACFGRNHALYGVAGFAAIFGLLALQRSWPQPARKLSAWCAGTLLGAAPLLAMLALVPGFAHSVYESVLFQLRFGSNLPYPAPWPWNAEYFVHDASLRARLDFAGLSLAFATAGAYLLVALGLVLRLVSKRESLAPRAVLVATAIFGCIYAYHASVRSDAPHIAQAIHPALLGLAALPASLGFLHRRAACAAWYAALLAIGGWTAMAYHPELGRFHPLRPPADLVPYTVRGDPLRIARPVAEYYAQVEGTFAQLVKPSDSALIVPIMPALYPLLDRRSPVWPIYIVWQGTPESQREIIDGLTERRVQWVLLSNRALDGRREFLFQNTHPLVWETIAREFERVEGTNLPARHRLWRRRSAPDGR